MLLLVLIGWILVVAGALAFVITRHIYAVLAVVVGAVFLAVAYLSDDKVGEGASALSSML